MSQAGAKVITRKLAHPDSNAGPSSPLTRGKITRLLCPFFTLEQQSADAASAEGSSCSVRIYQRRRVSETEMEVTDTSVGVSNTDNGRRRQFSVQSRRSSIQVGHTPSLTRVRESEILGPRIDTLVEGSGILDGERCASPVSLKACDGFCEHEDNPLRSATVVSCFVCPCLRSDLGR